MNRRGQWSVLGAVVAILIVAGWVVADKPTRLGLDLRGGVELIYEGRPTPQAPTVTTSSIDDAISTIRRRTDALGVAEPEIQRAGERQIIVSLPDVQDPERAIKQVGSTAQLYFYDWEANVLGNGGPDAPYSSLWAAVNAATKAKPKAEASDIPPEGVSAAVKRRFGDDQAGIRAYYDERNDTRPSQFYLFDSKRKLLVGEAQSCTELASDWKDARSRLKDAPAPAKSTGDCAKELTALGNNAPPAKSVVRQVPRGVVILRAEDSTTIKSAQVDRYYVIEDDAELAGRDLKNPEQNVDPNTREPIVTFELTKHGQLAFQRVTKRLADRGRGIILPPGSDRSATFQRFAIELDGQLISRATIDWSELPDGIDGKTGAQINGLGSLSEAQDLATQLRIGALPIELKLVSRTQVSATLGEEALKQAEKAFLVGFALVALFLIVFYRGFGVIAAVALIAYAVLMFALVKIIPITVTLPGIAGLVLTLGVAADANIVAFERIKEELRAGSGPARAVRDGYRKAIRTIADANVVTFGVAFILFMLATAGVKGFAFTLGVGTLTSLFTAVIGVGTVLSLASGTRILTKTGTKGGRTPRRLNFMGASRTMFTISGIIILVGALFISTRGINFGIDFESGTRVSIPATSTDRVESALRSIKVDGKVQQVSTGQERTTQISLPKLAPERVTEVKTALQRATGVESGDIDTSSIGPTFGKQIANAAIIAIIASLLLISLYIWYRFGLQFATPVIIAVGHDIIITAGVYSAFDREVTTATVAALLTILGYSLYDTIIVFDRIRENIPKMQGATINQIVNRSMSEVLVRSLVTSVSTLMPILALLTFGGETLQDFAFALLVGVLSGTYSSIFIASPLLAHALAQGGQMRQRLKNQLRAFGHEAPYYSPEIERGVRDVQLGRQQPVVAEPIADAPDPLLPKPMVIRPPEELIGPPSHVSSDAATLDDSAGGVDLPTGETDAPEPKRPGAAKKRRNAHGRSGGRGKKKGRRR